MSPQSLFLGASTVEFNEVVLTDTQLKNLEATPVQLVPAPGVGKFLEFVASILLADFSAGAYDATNTQLRVKYANGSGLVLSCSIIDSPAFFSTAGKQMMIAYPAAVQQATLVMGSQAQIENQPLVLHDNFGAGELTLGNAANTCKVITLYRTWDTGW